ncbi:MAG: sn-glycerol-3-phosphate ABC transporter ATP-binding protein UgpC [Deltaproteobacteria bacterium]|nr:sn-glycerol-3-phosphate ABC transporter ATP-binding protein UgpC [Deltaproteobacteria bacterium]
MAGVILKDVAKRFGAVSVIEGLNLEIREHEFMVLVGPSGCGKSTALRMIAGLEAVSGGTITIGNRVVNDVPPKDRDIAMVFQTYALYPHMTVRENLAFGLKMRKVPKVEADRLITEAVQILEISELLERKPKQLSGGQRQRVALGRAIVRKPAVFLFDEPLSNLDAKLRVQMRGEIMKLQQRLQTTSVYVTHDQVEAMTMGHRIAVMKSGKLQQVGTPLEVYERPANLFVADFIGTPPMNFIEATFGDGGTVIVANGFTLPVPHKLTSQAASRVGRRVVAGIRPEHLYGPGKAATQGSIKLDVVVDICETLGDEVIVHGRVGDSVLIFKLDPHRTPEVGSTIDIHVDLDMLHLFDGETEDRITCDSESSNREVAS